MGQQPQGRGKQGDQPQAADGSTDGAPTRTRRPGGGRRRLLGRLFDRRIIRCPGLVAPGALSVLGDVLDPGDLGRRRVFRRPRALRRLGIAGRSDLSPADARALGESLGARWVVYGSYVVSPASGGPADLRIQLQISDASSGEVLGWAREQGRGDEVLEIVERLLTSVRSHLVRDDPAPSQDLYFQGRLASSAESLELFARGAEALSRRDALEARGFLERAAAVDSDNPLNHSLLATAYEGLGLLGLAASSAERSAELAADLPWEYRTSVLARADRIAGRCEKAAERLATLHRRMPWEISYGARLSESQACAGRAEEALETLRSLRAPPLYGITDVHLDLKEVRLLVTLRRLAEAEALVTRMIEAAVERGAPVLAADGLADQFWIRLLDGR
ncbi:MAG: hypothetical protein AAFX50_21985, partial [Acidobacteriota bacterium]